MTDAKGKYRIQTVAEMTGVPASTLRTWEQRYGFPTPDRTASAYRVYSDDDIREIMRVRELCDRAIWLCDGQLRSDGHPDAVIAEYYASTEGR